MHETKHCRHSISWYLTWQSCRSQAALCQKPSYF